MKILIVHNQYQQKGGEDFVVEAEAKLLVSKGHQVKVSLVNNNVIKTKLDELKIGISVAYSSYGRRWIRAELENEDPDLVHVHNFFPLLSTSIYDECAEFNVPVVQTLHNYRILCPAATFRRNGKVCEDCLHGSFLPAIRHRCYRKSLLGTIAVSRMAARNLNSDTWGSKVACIIALTGFSKSKYLDGGLSGENIVVKPNFVWDNPGYGYRRDDFSSGQILYVGRLNEEKGVTTLLEAVKDLDGFNLVIAGDGPLLSAISSSSKEPKIRYIGEVSKRRVIEEMDKSAFLVIPSEWYEGFPIVLLEAFSRGLPVIASDIGSLSELVVDGQNGLLFEAGNPSDLAKKINWMLTNPIRCIEMGREAREKYLRLYSPEKNYKILIEIYENVLTRYSKNFENEGSRINDE